MHSRRTEIVLHGWHLEYQAGGRSTDQTNAMTGDAPLEKDTTAIDAAVFDSLRDLTGEKESDLASAILVMFTEDATDVAHRLRVAMSWANRSDGRRAAHQLMGSALVIGAVTVADICRRIEACAPVCEPGEILNLVSDLERATAETVRLLQLELARPAHTLGGAA